MFEVSRAKRQDYEGICELLQTHSLFKITPEHLNHHDIALKATDTGTGETVGFVWGGLMAQNTEMYIDKVTIASRYARMGVCQLLYSELFKRAMRRGVRRGWGIIRHGQFHDKAAVNALKMAFGADAAPYTFVFGDAENILKELSKSEAA